MEGIWFKAKKYGWGWYPSSWQGWSILLIWFSLVLIIFKDIEKYSNSLEDALIEFFIPILLLVILLLFVCYGTGEKPRWRWGK